jgi:hypothetical protein
MGARPRMRLSNTSTARRERSQQLSKVVREPAETQWGVMLGDFLHNCRTALDHLVCQLVVLSGNKAWA